MENELERHNKAVLKSLEEGDLVEIDRGVYSHWGVSMGDDTIVHLTGVNYTRTAVDSVLSNVPTNSGSGMDKACVKMENLLDVAGNSKVKKNNNKDGITSPFTAGKIKERALSKLGKTSYSLLWDNCEHFAAWCRNGISQSNQADTGYTCSVALGAMAVIGGLYYKANTVSAIPGAFIDVGKRLWYAAFTGGNDTSTVLRALTDFGRRFYSGYPGRNVGSMMYEIKQNVGLEWPFPGDEMMRKAWSDLYSKSYSIVFHCRDYFVNGIPVFQVNTGLYVAGSLVAAVAVAWAAYKLYVHREKVARGIKNCCSLVANGICSLFGKLFSW